MNEIFEPAGGENQELESLLKLTGIPGPDLKKDCQRIVEHYLSAHGFTETYLFQPERQRMAEKLFIVLQRFPGINIKEKTIIDLGCGNNGGTEANEEAYVRNEPWFCRLLHELGANIIGIDNGYLDREPFSHFQLDLTVPGALDFIGDESADVVMADHFFHSEDLLYQKMRNPKLNIKDLRMQLFPQIQRILKRNGFYLEDDETGRERYFTHNSYELDHEQYSIHEVNRLFWEIHEEPAYARIYIAKKISELMFPYLCRDYDYSPADEDRHLIEFHCAATLDRITSLLADIEIFRHSIVEFMHEPENGSRINEPWISRFLEMAGAKPLTVPLPQDEKATPACVPAENSVDIAISPLLNNLTEEQKQKYFRQVKTILKDNGHHLEREERSVGIKGKNGYFGT